MIELLSVILALNYRDLEILTRRQVEVHVETISRSDQNSAPLEIGTLLTKPSWRHGILILDASP